MKIKLSGRHAIGAHEYAIVDDEDYAELAQYSWKAKPNGPGNNVYAVRNSKVDGKNVTIRMHRYVMQYVGALDIDHINHNSLDNRKQNLRVVTRSINCKNRKTIVRKVTCGRCAAQYSVIVKGSSRVSQACRKCRESIAQQKRSQSRLESANRKNKICQLCGSAFIATAGHQKFCSAVCKDKAKYILRKTSKVLPSNVKHG
jgi:hypothetical protein